MKKILLITLIVVFTFTLSFAAISDESWGTPDSNDYKLSNNVEMYYDVDDTTNAQNYAIMTKHYNGDKVYATVNTSTVVYVQDEPDGEDWKGKSGGEITVKDTPSYGDSGASTLDGSNSWSEL
jgi:hypothetical protein